MLLPPLLLLLLLLLKQLSHVNVASSPQAVSYSSVVRKGLNKSSLKARQCHSGLLSFTPAPISRTGKNTTESWMFPKKKKQIRNRQHSPPPQQPSFNDTNPFAPLADRNYTAVTADSARDVLVVGDSIVRSIKVDRSVVECNRGACVLDINRQIPALLNKHQADTVLIHAGTNDIFYRQSETLKEHFKLLRNTVHSHGKSLVISGPLPRLRRGIECFSRLYALNEWLKVWTASLDVAFVDNFDTFWQRPCFYKRDGVHPNQFGSDMLSENINKALTA
uniref:SGNH hydrolase-type esterase domain-containing protein n=1 Tax=Astyanax mexicanus TaxID=7994 RepID=A0A8B9KKA6_ASTMX